MTRNTHGYWLYVGEDDPDAEDGYIWVPGVDALV